MKRARLLAALWVLAVALPVAVARAPARLIAWLPVPPELAASGFSGTLWRGSAARVLLRLPAGTVHLGRVHWQLHPLSLTLLRPALSLRSEWGDQRLAVRAQWAGGDRWLLREGELQLGAGLLRQVLPVELGGRISARIDQLLVQSGQLRVAQGRAVWERARWRAPQADFALGTYALNFGPDGDPGAAADAPAGPLRAEVITLQGPLEVSGSARLERSAWSLALDFGSEGGLPATLANALSLLAIPEGEGYRLRLSGELPVR